MDKERFREFLRRRNVSEDKIEQGISIVARFEGFLNKSDRPKTLEQARAEDVHAFSQALIKDKLNTFDNFVALARYGQFANNNALYVAVIELLDGSEALENLYKKLADEIGEKKRDEIFYGIDLPPLGTPNTKKPRLTETVLERMERAVGPQTCKRILGSGLRTLPDEEYLKAKKKYLEAGSLDAYLERKGKEFIAELEKLRDEGGLFFTQPITDEVIDFVRSHPEIRQGVREGNVLYEAKIPYMTVKYLAETDERMKRYTYCHCPWVREAIRAGDANVPPVFCNCSAAFHKKPYEVIFGRPLEAEVLETVLKGDRWCKFAIHLPEDAV
jgi:hypothetical protein